MMKRIRSSLLVTAVLIALYPAAVLAGDAGYEAPSTAAMSGYFLEAADQAVYSGLAEGILKTADNGGSTEIVLDVSGKGVNFEIGGIAESGAYIGKYGIDVKKVFLSLLRDYPYVMYWYDAAQMLKNLA